MHSWIYGRHPVFETLRANRRSVLQLLVAEGVQQKGTLKQILDLCDSRSIKINWTPKSKLDDVEPRNQGVLLEVGEYPYDTLDNIIQKSRLKKVPPLLLLLDSLQDTQNLGTLIRTADAVGVHGIILPKHRAASITPAVVNASSGASEHVAISQDNLSRAIDVLKEEDIWIVGLEYGIDALPPGKIPFDGPIAIVVGNEGEGLRHLVKKKCDFLLSLPMRGKVGSLNAATAGSVVLYLIWQARGFD